MMIRTQSYRGRQIVAGTFAGLVREDKGSDPSDIDNEWSKWYGLTDLRVEDDTGVPLTPVINELEGWMYGYRFTFASMLEVTGFGLVGDFIFFVRAGTDNWGVGPASELYLVCPGPGDGVTMTLDEFLDSDRVIPIFRRTGNSTQAHSKTNYRERQLPRVMARFSGDACWVMSEFVEKGKFASYHEEHVVDHSDAGTVLKVNADDVWAVGGIARLFVPDYGWRWLFPHEGGSLAALQRLKATTDSDDDAALAAMWNSPDMTDAARRLITYQEAHERLQDIADLFDKLHSGTEEGKPSPWDCSQVLRSLTSQIDRLY